MSHAKTIDVKEAATGWVLDLGVGHMVRRRGPVLAETVCGACLPGPIVHDEPSRVCRRCFRIASVEAKARREAAIGAQKQGRLF